MLSEFKKRIAQAGGANSKAKLNFTGMNLHDKQVNAFFSPIGVHEIKVLTLVYVFLCNASAHSSGGRIGIHSGAGQTRAK